MEGIEVTEYVPARTARQLSPGMRKLLADSFADAEARGYEHGFEEGRAGGFLVLVWGLLIGAASGAALTVAVSHFLK